MERRTMHNQITLIGNLGRDPEVKQTSKGGKYALLSVATHSKIKGENTAKPVQQVASAKRSTNTGRKNTVRLTSSQVAIAKKLGVPLEEYAKQLKITKEV